MMLLPYRYDITFTRVPIVNAVLIGITCVTFIFTEMGIFSDSVVEGMMLKDWSPEGMLGNVFLHAGIVHLAGNMVFLWVFGNAVCSTVGNRLYLPLYFGFAITASIIYLSFSTEPAIGASGAINGVVGMSLVLFPVSRLSVWYMILFPGFFPVGTFQLRSFWMVCIWLFFDILGVIVGGTGIGYWAHLGGFAAGVFLGLVLLATRVVVTFDTNLWDILTGNRPDSDLFDPVGTMPALYGGGHALQIQQQISPENTRGRHVIHAQGAIDPETARIHRMMTGDYEPQVQSPSRPSQFSLPLKLRVLRVTSEMSQTTCYFVNEGEEIRDLVVSSPQGLLVDVHPPRGLRRGEPGWFRFSIPVGRIPLNPGFILGYTTVSGTRQSRSMMVSEADKKILSGALA